MVVRCPAFKGPETAPLGLPESQPEVSVLPRVCQSRRCPCWVRASSSHISSFLQSVLWWLPVERAFWRQVRVGSSASFSTPVDSHSRGLASVDPLPIRDTKFKRVTEISRQRPSNPVSSALVLFPIAHPISPLAHIYAPSDSGPLLTHQALSSNFLAPSSGKS